MRLTVRHLDVLPSMRILPSAHSNAAHPTRQAQHNHNPASRSAHAAPRSFAADPIRQTEETYPMLNEADLKMPQGKSSSSAMEEAFSSFEKCAHYRPESNLRAEIISTALYVLDSKP